MTEIEGVGRPTAPRAMPRSTAKSGMFNVPSEAHGTRAAAAATAGEPVALASMLALQEVDRETVADREARRHGQDMLAALADLQKALLAVGSDTGVMDRLAALADVVPRATDRRLAALVSAIVVRVRVELARRKT